MNDCNTNDRQQTVFGTDSLSARTGMWCIECRSSTHSTRTCRGLGTVMLNSGMPKKTHTELRFRSPYGPQRHGCR